MIQSIDPATLEVVGEVPETPVEDLGGVFARARVVQREWRTVPAKERARRVAHITRYIADHFDAIADLISREVGKPPAEAFVSEVYVAMDSTFTYFDVAEQELDQTKEVPLGFYNSLDKRSYLTAKPVGVVTVIGPYNYPFIIPLEQIVQALMTGNAVVFKPSSETPLVGQKIQELFDSTDLPAGLIQTVCGAGSVLGNALVDAADLVVFTGSTETGKRIMRRAADTLTPVVLELGGKSAMVVFPDANLDRALLAARWGVFTNSGQVCSSVKRLYVHADIENEFTRRLVELTRALEQGPPREPEIDVGAMINLEQLQLVNERVQQAVAEGAHVLCGGRRNPDLEGYFYEPTLINHVTNDMAVVQQEIFGPVLVIIPFEEEAQVVDLVNDSPYGLTASVWTGDTELGERVAHEINAGTVMVNEVVYTFGLARTPWGGTKSSGIGRTHGPLGFQEVVRPLHVHVDTYAEPDPWWMPYDSDFEEMMANFKEIARRLVVA